MSQYLWMSEGHKHEITGGLEEEETQEVDEGDEPM
jgi:hypothetical protein